VKLPPAESTAAARHAGYADVTASAKLPPTVSEGALPLIYLLDADGPRACSARPGSRPIGLPAGRRLPLCRGTYFAARRRLTLTRGD
jgi:hypothetical protein